VNNLKNIQGEVAGETVIVKSIEELGAFAGVFLKKIEEIAEDAALQSNEKAARQDGEKDEKGAADATIVGLSGDLGAGKTTFSKCIAGLLGVQEVVTSPTFGIQKQYKTSGQEIFEEFVHIDAYRIEDIKEIETLRFVELFQRPKTLIFIEWPEKIAEALPKGTTMLSFESVDEHTRKISY
jgi:tRNA threonylcarbamoyladenosine biosynthesis protein TsaE